MAPDLLCESEARPGVLLLGLLLLLIRLSLRLLFRLALRLLHLLLLLLLLGGLTLGVLAFLFEPPLLSLALLVGFFLGFVGGFLLLLCRFLLLSQRGFLGLLRCFGLVAGCLLHFLLMYSNTGRVRNGSSDKHKRVRVQRRTFSDFSAISFFSLS